MATKTSPTALIANEIERHRVLHDMHLVEHYMLER